MILSQVVDECGRAGTDSDCENIVDRIRALVEAGRLEAQGDLSKWRNSEIRLAND